MRGAPSGRLRIVGGALRGRVIRAPDGGDIRPTADRARQAVFNVLEHAPWSPGVEGARVLDGFAGSGALGIEALSRGAASCLFVDTAEPALAAIRANVGALGLEARAELRRLDLAKPGKRTGEAFGLVLLDPPYGKALGEAALTALADGGWLASQALCVLEQGAAEPSPDLPGFEQIDQRRYGAARVSFLRVSGKKGGERRKALATEVVALLSGQGRADQVV